MHRLTLTGWMVDMLTPIDESLNKLEDLTPKKIVRIPLSVVYANADSLYGRENMKGWIEHFSNMYIICGRLVEN